MAWGSHREEAREQSRKGGVGQSREGAGPPTETQPAVEPGGALAPQASWGPRLLPWPAGNPTQEPRGQRLKLVKRRHRAFPFGSGVGGRTELSDPGALRLGSW